jgi:hypothetical protein
MEFPERFHAAMDTRRWGPGERIVFEPYSREAFSQSFEWIAEHAIFELGNMGAGDYDQAVVSIDRSERKSPEATTGSVPDGQTCPSGTPSEAA